MMKVAYCIITIQAPMEFRTGSARAMKECRCHKAGTEDFNLGMLVSGGQMHSNVATQNSPSPIENKAGSQAKLS